jgi:phosphatidylglycerol---prolipoprotein diacylglyceryl transferase
MHGALIHVGFDVLAWMAAGASALWLSRGRAVAFPAVTRDLPYLAAVLFGAGLGAYLFGTVNLWLSGLPGIARSIEGAVAGGILAVEFYKRRAGITARTGARFALPLALGVTIGRIGCYLAGLDDFTHGTPTAVPWAHDFGDGVPRHPVQLYESATMAAFALLYVARVVNHDRFWIDQGFYLAVGWYGLQRFAWEFIKPYGPLIGPFTVFHLLSAALVIYAAVLVATAPNRMEADDPRLA